MVQTGTVKVVVAGASGFVGRKLVPRLAAAGHQVVALSRNPGPAAAGDQVEFMAVDVGDAAELSRALSGAGAAYYLIHSMAGENFVKKDLALAAGFAEAAAAAGVGRIVYQGALGRGRLSAHLSSRQEVGRALGSTGVPVVELRAAVILGSGSTSFEMMRYLTERLPMMICPRWVRTRTEPIALSDVLEYLVRGLEAPPGVYEIGCGEVTSYQDMMHRYAEVRGLRYRPILNVPLLTLHLSGYWVDLITPLDRKVTHALIGSMTSSVTVRDAGRTLAAFRIEPLSLEESMQKALDDQAAQLPDRLFDGFEGLSENVYRVYLEHKVDPEAAAAIRTDLAGIGGDLAWYGWPWAWRGRFLLGMLLGERHPIGRPQSMTAGEAADWWIIERTTQDALILRSAGWLTGEGWLGYSIPPGGDCLKVAAAFRPRGLPGFLYWFLLTPVHKAAFRAMAKARIRRAARTGGPDPS
ncbi:SDR family oxidoreductase [soil metagenome]